MVAAPRDLTRHDGAITGELRSRFGRRTLRAPLLRDSTPHLRRIVHGAKFELIPMKSLDRALGELAPRSNVSITCSPTRSIEATLDETERLVAAGHTVTPHLSARMVHTPEHLVDIHARLCEIGIREVFVVGGDAASPGCYFDAIEFIAALIELDDAAESAGSASRQIDHIGYAAYPDTHPFIGPGALHDALHAKQRLISDSGRTAHVTTQMCFSAARIESWLLAERNAGFTVPVHLGVAGVIDKTKLLTMGVRLGVGTSLRYLSKNRTAVGALLTKRSYDPSQLLRALTDGSDDRLLELNIDGLHLFTFNQVEATEQWRRRVVN